MENLTTPRLQPLRLGELFDQAIRIYRRNFLVFVGIVALVYIPYTIFATASSSFFIVSTQSMKNSQEIVFSPAYWMFLISILVGVLLHQIFVDGLATAALTNAVAQVYIHGRKISILDSYRLLGMSAIHLLIVMFLFSILTSIVSTWAIVPIVGWLTGLGAMIFLQGVVDKLLAPIVVLEKTTWFEPIVRAWNLARRRFWWLLGVSLVFSLFSLIIVTGPTLLMSSLSNTLIGREGNLYLLSTILATVLSGTVYLVTTPILIIAKTLIYFDLRVRTEGFDLALSTLAPTEEGTNIDIASLPIPASEQKWLTGDDIGKFAIISLGIFGIIGLTGGVLFLLLTLVSSASGK